MNGECIARLTALGIDYAEKRLAKIMAKYPQFASYLQTDPRGASLYILRPGDVPEGQNADSYYSRGIAVYK